MLSARVRVHGPPPGWTQLDPAGPGGAAHGYGVAVLAGEFRAMSGLRAAAGVDRLMAQKGRAFRQDIKPPHADKKSLQGAALGGRLPSGWKLWLQGWNEKLQGDKLQRHFWCRTSSVANQQSPPLLELLIRDDCVEGVVPEGGGDPKT